MKRHAIAALIVLAGSLLTPALSAPSTDPKSSNVVSITLPGDIGFRFKNGPGVEQANTYCLTCHSSAYVSTQPPLDREHWTAEVTKMRKAYRAEIPDKDAETIAGYLTQVYGKP